MTAEARSNALAPAPDSESLAGTGGTLRTTCEDFVVDEDLGFEADKQAQRHLLFRLSKRELNTKEAVACVAKHCGVPAVEFGVAGLKDRHAVTHQWVSAPAPTLAKLERFKHAQITLGTPIAHTHKLRRGHARANKFRIIVRDTSEHWPELIAAKLRSLDARVPNFYGEQRFGADGRNLDEGLRRLVQRGRARDADFFVNAAQSAIFNLYLLERRRNGLDRKALRGDLLLDATGRLHSCETPQDEHDLARQGLQLSGPMVGGSIDRPAAGTEAAEFEDAFFSGLGIGAKHFKAWGKAVRGARRALRVNLEKLQIEALSPSSPMAGYRVEFALPTGAYATVALNEFMRPTH